MLLMSFLTVCRLFAPFLYVLKLIDFDVSNMPARMKGSQAMFKETKVDDIFRFCHLTGLSFLTCSN
jgi:hypothetical protein